MIAMFFGLFVFLLSLVCACMLAAASLKLLLGD